MKNIKDFSDKIDGIFKKHFSIFMDKFEKMLEVSKKDNMTDLVEEAEKIETQDTNKLSDTQVFGSDGEVIQLGEKLKNKEK